MPPNQTLLLTGGTAGIGRRIADEAAHRGWTVVLACRDLEAGCRIAGELAGSSGSRVVPLQMDLADLESVCTGARALHGMLVDADLPPLRAVVMKAAVQTLDMRRRSAQGVPLSFAVSYLGHAAMLRAIMDDLAEQACLVACVNFTSKPTSASDFLQRVEASRFGGGPWPGPLAGVLTGDGRTIISPACLAPLRIYATAKLALARMVVQASRVTPAIYSRVFDPGTVAESGMLRPLSPTLCRLLGIAGTRLAGVFPSVFDTGPSSARQVLSLVDATLPREVFWYRHRHGAALPCAASLPACALRDEALIANWDDTDRMLRLLGFPASCVGTSDG